MKRSSDRILTTHVGSIPRPPEIRTSTGPSADHAVRAAVADVVRQQIDCGIDIVNDGEFGKSSWSTYVLSRITGFELRPDRMKPVDWLGRDRERFHDFFETAFPRAITGAATEACVGPIAYRDHEPIRRCIADLQAALEKTKPVESFLTAIAPASTAYDGVNEFYKTEEEYIYAIADALREEYLEIHNAGILLQVDDAVLANMYDYLVAQSPERYRKWAELRVAALNHALRGIPEDRIRYHVCFGSWHVPHVADAPLDDIVDFILQVRAGANLIEAANPRHEHEWRVWQNHRLPEGKILVPGVITHHLVTVEHPRLVADRIVRFANLVGRENIIAGTDCGFAQTEAIARQHPSVMWAKFEALVEGARIATRELWP